MKRKIVQIVVMGMSLLTLCACGASETKPESTRKDIYVYLIGGQSNASGCGYVGDLSEAERATIYEHVYYYGGGEHANIHCRDQLLKVTAGQGTFEFSFGLELGMAKILTEEYEKDGVERAIIKYGYSGSSIKSLSDGMDWNVYDDAGTGAHYDKFIEVVTAGLQALKDAGFNPVIKGMAWMQGETDYLVSDYKARLIALRDKVRIDLNVPAMPFVMGEIAYQNYGKKNYVNNAIKAISEEEPTLCSFVACGNLAPRCRRESDCAPVQTASGGPFDHLHWSGENLLEIGRMFATELVALNG
ncbi:MAG: hypothetical protein IKU26_07535 [Clostridia bacterium]|nr:hypothetical protein [Clostridia bacterium]